MAFFVFTPFTEAPMSEERLLTPREAAERLRVPLSWIYDKTLKKAIPFMKVGKYIRISENVFEEWLKNKE